MANDIQLALNPPRYIKNGIRLSKLPHESAKPASAEMAVGHEPAQLAVNDNTRGTLLAPRVTTSPPRTRESANASATLVETLRAMVREIVREEMAVARPATADATAHLSTRAAAKHAGVALGTIRRWIHDGKLRELRAGRHLRVRRADLDALLLGDRNGPELSPEELARQAFGG